MEPSKFIQVELQKVKETKNMIRYDADALDENASRQGTVPNIYIRKTALANAFGGFPASIKLTIEEK